MAKSLRNCGICFHQKEQYLKNILIYSRYKTYESIITLKEQTVEVEGMISFIKDMSDIIDEKEEIFGIFSQHPQKLMILPGLKPIFSKFIEKVETLKALSRITCHTPMVKNKNTNNQKKNK